MDEKTQDLWSQFQEMTALHKFYFETIIKGASFSMGIIGGIVTYAVAASANDSEGGRSLISLLLLFPAIVSGGSAIVFLLGALKAWDLSNNVQKMQRRLNFEWRPHAELLVWIACIFGVLFFLTTIVLFWVIADPGILRDFATTG